MYAVYGLNDNNTECQEFIGYISANFFDHFTDPEGWSIATVSIEGIHRTGRLYGNAFFVNAANKRANKNKIKEYMGIEQCFNDNSSHLP